MKIGLLVASIAIVSGAAFAANVFHRSTEGANEGAAHASASVTVTPSGPAVSMPTVAVTEKAASACESVSSAELGSGDDAAAPNIGGPNGCCLPCDGFNVCACAVRCKNGAHCCTGDCCGVIKGPP